MFTAAAQATVANVSLTEIMYHPADPTLSEQAAGFRHGEDFQYIILRNLSSVNVSLGDLNFTLGVEFLGSFTPQSLLAPGASVALVRNVAAFRFRYGATALILGTFRGHLSYDAETIVLINHLGSTLAAVDYSDTAPWPIEADGYGYSLVLADPAAHPPLQNAASWRLSLDPGGESNHQGVLPFATWQSRYFPNPADSAPTADPDADGMNNLLEYALGQRPTQANHAPAVHFINLNGALGIEFPRRMGLSGISLIPQSTSGLDIWSALPQPLPTTTNTAGTETVRIALPNAARRFFRVLATQP
jgi:hypothetical protein